MDRMNRIARILTIVAISSSLTILLAIQTLSILSSASAHTANRPLGTPPSIKGAVAIRQLKKEGLYDSLQKAMDTARYEACWKEEPANGSLPSPYHAANPDAIYPLTINPTFTQQQKLTAFDGAEDDFFGASIDVSRDTVVVGVPWDDVGGVPSQGSAYVFVRDGPNWAFQQKLIANIGMTSAYFGCSVAINGAGDTIVIGAKGDSPGYMENRPGLAYVFTRSGTTWLQQQRLIPVDGENGDQFGFQVDIQSNRIVIGSPFGNGLNGDQGAAYIFNLLSGRWIFNSKLTARDGMEFDQFGWSVSIAGEIVVVGASGADNNENVNQGAAYIFTTTGITWIEQQKLIAAGGMAWDKFGTSVAVAIDRRTVVVGAPGSNSGVGAAYVFARPPNGPTWFPQQKLTAFDGGYNDYGTRDAFGTSVSILETTVVVGAPYDDVGMNSDQGSAYIFERIPNIPLPWNFQQKLTATGGADSDRFGISVSIVYEQVVVGAEGADVGANSNQGSAYVFKRN